METLNHSTQHTLDFSHDDHINNRASLDNDPPINYQILKEGRETTGKWVTNEKLRMDYLSCTANLIDKITQGVEIDNEETGEKEWQPYSTVIFIDRSARPLSHLVRNTWDRFAKDPDTGEVPVMPDVKFLNFSRKHWIEQLDPNGSGILNLGNLDDNVYSSLRSVFLTPESKQQLKNTDSRQSANNLPALLDNQRVLIVDETKYTGETVRIAIDFMKKAFPTAHFDGTYWMNEQLNGTARNPIWDATDHQTDGMKGISKRYASLGVKALAAIPETNYYARDGRKNFISSPLDSNKEYLELIHELKALSTDRSVPVWPRERRKESDADYAKRMLTYTYDIDVSTLSQDEKDILLNETFDKILSIEAEARKHNPHIR